MMFTSLLAASALASQAAAFLVPLEVAKAAKTIEEDLHLSLIDTKTESIPLQCPGCFFDTENDRQEDYAVQPENYLVRETHYIAIISALIYSAGFELYHQ